jgi:hypothetical protein
VHPSQRPLYVHESKLRSSNNFVGRIRAYVGADAVIPTGTHQVRMEFAYGGDGAGKGGDRPLYVDSSKVGEGPREGTHALPFRSTEPSTSARTPASPCR